ncbi:MAG: LLM class flavin-dependent oxidoreductase [Halioglobus sp.]
MSLNIKIGATSWKSGPTWSARALCEQAEMAESIGLHSYWLPENHFGDARTMPSPLTLLAAISATTSRIKLGTVSYLIPIRHPIQAAEEVAVLDNLCEGRLILGVGRGIQDSVFRAFDLPSKDKRKRFAHNFDIMINAWSGQSIVEDAKGERIYLAPLPIQKPYPPIWVAAFGPLALQQVAKLGLPYLASPVETLSSLRSNYDEYHRKVREAGQDAVTTIPVMRTVYVTEDRQQANNLKMALSKTAASIVRDESAPVDEWTIIGDPQFVRDQLARYAQELGMTHLIASGRLPGLSAQDVVNSHSLLMECSV